MFTRIRNYCLAAALGLVSLAFVHAPAYATPGISTTYTISATTDAGLTYNSNGFAYIMDLTSGTPYTLSLAQEKALETAISTNAGNASGLESYISSTLLTSLGGSSSDAWWLYSAGSDSTYKSAIAVSTTLSAGTYKFALGSDVYTYDTVGWSSSFGKTLSLLEITVVTGGTATTYNLGSSLTTSYGTSLTLVLGSASTVYFWIPDNNTIDNSGDVTVTVTDPVPLPPSALLLLSSGLPLLVPRFRRYIGGATRAQAA